MADKLDMTIYETNRALMRDLPDDKLILNTLSIILERLKQEQTLELDQAVIDELNARSRQQNYTSSMEPVQLRPLTRNETEEFIIKFAELCKEWVG